jgi:O-antigen ligase/tetratricopeptide (TPR) repeat protein
MEAVVLAQVCLSPWALGAVHPALAVYALGAVGAVCVLWAARAALDGRWAWAGGPVALCLGGLFLFGVAQAAALPAGVLTWLSPGVARLREELGAGGAGPLSLDPGASRAGAVRLLAVFLLFAAVRSNLAQPAALRRLAVAALVNGCLLTLFALIQGFTSPPRTVYWSVPVDGGVFGPFVCRNHFPYYASLCIGLGLTLVLGNRDAVPVRRRGLGGRAPQAPAGPWGWLEKPGSLWAAAAVALVATGVVASRSRGGVLALLGAGAACGALRLAVTSGRRPAAAALGLLALLALGVAAGAGVGKVGERLDTVLSGEALQEDRLACWARVLPLAADFPLLGTGLGTFPAVEPLTRGPTDAPDWVWDHAHNDYLEALIEGGVARLLITLAAVTLVLRAGVTALRRGGADAAPALGLLFGFTAVALHSAVDFGLHVPAVAALATVACAHLCALGEGSGGDAAPRRSALRVRGLAAYAAAAVTALLGVAVFAEGRRADRVERLRTAAGLASAAADPDGRHAEAGLLAAAVRLAPADAGLWARLGDAEASGFRGRQESAVEALRVRDAAGAALAGAAPGVSGLAGLAAATAAGRLRLAAEAGAGRDELAAAAANWRRARELCPLLPAPHLRLAAHADLLPGGGSPAAHLRRASRLRPSDAEVAFLAGAEALREGEADGAWPAWRRSLAASDSHLGEVLEAVRGRLGPSEVVARLLPDDPRQLLAAADRLYPSADDPGRRPFLERALELSDRRPDLPRPEDYQMRGALLRALGRPGEAAAAYQAALARAPHHHDWRCELARLLHEQGRDRDARDELLAVLAADRGNGPARSLLEALAVGDPVPR